MESKVTININQKDNEKQVKRMPVTPGDIVLVKDIRENRTLLTRVIRLNTSTYSFYVLGEALVYEIENNNFIRVEDIVTNNAGSEIQILGICDVEISVTNIKKYIE